jgi:hypothetical protein
MEDVMSEDEWMAEYHGSGWAWFAMVVAAIAAIGVAL